MLTYFGVRRHEVQPCHTLGAPGGRHCAFGIPDQARYQLAPDLCLLPLALPVAAPPPPHTQTGTAWSRWQLPP